MVSPQAVDPTLLHRAGRVPRVHRRNHIDVRTAGRAYSSPTTRSNAAVARLTAKRSVTFPRTLRNARSICSARSPSSTNQASSSSPMGNRTNRSGANNCLAAGAYHSVGGCSPDPPQVRHLPLPSHGEQKEFSSGGVRSIKPLPSQCRQIPLPPQSSHRSATTALLL